MNIILKIRVVVVMAVMGCAVVSSVGETLTWNQCLTLAARHNPSLAAACAKIEAAEAGIGVAHSSMLPQLSLEASANQGNQVSSGASFQGNNQTDNGNGGGSSYGTTATIEQSLYSGGKNKAEERVAEATLAMTSASAAGTGVQVVFDLRSAFVNMLYAQEQVKLLQAIAIRRKDNQELVGLRYEGGREHKGSLALSQASLFDAQIQLKQAERQVSVNGKILLRVIGVDASATNLAVSGDMEAKPVPEGLDLRALAERTPSYNTSIAAIEVAKAQVESARGTRRPDISLAGSAGLTGGESPSNNNDWSVGLKLSFPIWSGGKATHAIRKAKAALAESEANREDALNGLIRTLTEAQQAYANAVESVEVQRRYVEAADIRAEIARQQYEDGLLTFENWSLIEDDLISRRKQLVDARKNAMAAEASWWRAMGFNLVAGGERKA